MPSFIERRRAAAAKRSRSSGPVRRTAARSASVRRTARRRSVSTHGFLGIERKFYDTSLPIDDAGAPQPTQLKAPTGAAGGEYDPSTTSMISTPAQGDSEQNRDGKRINILSLEIEGVITTQAKEGQAAPPGDSSVFIAIVLDKQTNGAQMNSEDCFLNH